MAPSPTPTTRSPGAVVVRELLLFPLGPVGMHGGFRVEALRGAISKIEGAKLLVNRERESDGGGNGFGASGGRAWRAVQYQERIGTIRRVEFVEGHGLVGDLHLNPQHPTTNQLAWDAQNAPNAIGFRIDGRLEFDDIGVSSGTGGRRVKRIASVNAIEITQNVGLPGIGGNGMEHRRSQSTEQKTGVPPVDELSAWLMDRTPQAKRIREVEQAEYVKSVATTNWLMDRRNDWEVSDAVRKVRWLTSP